MNRRALLIAPTYDGKLCPAVACSSELLHDLSELLARHGGYTVQQMDGIVDMPQLRSGLRELFDTDGEVFVYFYGHGVLRDDETTVLCRSQAVEDDEGLSLAELLKRANDSQAREAIVVIDACRRGASWTPHHAVIQSESAPLLTRPGRAFLAACRATQESTIDEDSNRLSQFSQLALAGLQGGALSATGGEITASVLFRFVADGMTKWGQDPVMTDIETGQHRCRIVTLATPRASTQPPILGRRLGLPFRPSALFVGREAEIESLTTVLCDDARPLALAATVEGLGGVGKTELVLQLLETPEVRGKFPSVLWFDASAPLQPQWAHFASKLDENTESESNLAEGVISALASHGRILIVLDNATSWEDVREQIPDEAAVLVTTRSRSFGDSSFIRRELHELSPEASVELLRDLVSDADRGTLRKLAERLDD
jgi:hypothetical protein